MAKFEHVAERDAIKEFLEEVNAQCWRYGYKSQSALGEAIGISQPTAGKYLKDPSDMTFVVLRKLIQTLKPNPVVLLKALGYTTKDINSLSKERQI